jgi:hypothetical protein
VIAAIGIDRYLGWPRLTNAVADARGAVALFERLGFEQVTEPLLDGAATGKALEGLVKDDLKKLGPDDSLVLFYAGHGGTRAHRLGDQVIKTGHLIPADASDRAATWIELDGWLRAVSLLPARHILVILDACHSGIALGPIIKWRASPRRDRFAMSGFRTSARAAVPRSRRRPVPGSASRMPVRRHCPGPDRARGGRLAAADHARFTRPSVRAHAHRCYLCGMKRRTAPGVAMAAAVHVLAMGAAVADPEAPPAPAPAAPARAAARPVPWIAITTGLRPAIELDGDHARFDVGATASISVGGPALGLSDLRAGVYGDHSTPATHGGLTLSALRRQPVVLRVGGGVREDGARFSSQTLAAGVGFPLTDPGERPRLGYVMSLRLAVTAQQSRDDWRVTIGTEIDPVFLAGLFFSSLLRSSGT